MALQKQKVDTLVIGGGQAGIAMSEHLSKHDIEHLILEKDRIAESWRSRRWDSLVTNGPRWNDRFPNLKNEGPQDDFVHHDDLADYFQRYAEMIDAPIQTGVEVTRVSRNVSGTHGGNTYLAETSEGNIEAKNIVIATGPHHQPFVPPVIPESSDFEQIHSVEYKNPQQLAEGAVLVVGSGASGVQIAQELHEHGRDVYLSVGPHIRPPRRYRGRDIIWWMGVLGIWNDTEPKGNVAKGFCVSGTHGGKTVDFRKLANDGMTLLGMTDHYTDGKLYFNTDLEQNVTEAEQAYLDLLNKADKFIADNGLDFPEEPQAHELLPMPKSIQNPITELDMKQAGIKTVIWATGFRSDYSWVDLDIFDDVGRPIHKQGVSAERGVYFIGLPFMTCRGSSFIWGVWHDANHIAHKISVQAGYDLYEPERQ